jgi:exosortase/archaeosortase family protein
VSGPAGLLRLTLLAAIASAQLTLAARAEVMDFTIIAALSWFAGGVLLLEHEQESAPENLGKVSRLRFAAGAGLLLWCLTVLTFAARLYDPLFWLLPILALPGLALVAGVPPRAPLTLQLVLIGALVPLQGLLNVLIPVAPLARITARLSSSLLWLSGLPAFAEGAHIVLPGKVLFVDGACTGRTTLSFCLATLVVLLILLPLPPRRQPSRQRHPLLDLAALGIFTFLCVLLVNSVRIVILAFAVKEPGPGFLAALQGFTFWHDGAGAQVFSLASSSLVCLMYVLLLESKMQRVSR